MLSHGAACATASGAKFLAFIIRATRTTHRRCCASIADSAGITGFLNPEQSRGGPACHARPDHGSGVGHGAHLDSPTSPLGLFSTPKSVRERLWAIQALPGVREADEEAAARSVEKPGKALKRGQAHYLTHARRNSCQGCRRAFRTFVGDGSVK